MGKKFKPGDRVYHRNLKEYGTFIGYAWESEEECDVDIYNGQGIMSQMFMKKRQIIALRECSFCMIEEFDGKMECTKNRYGNRTMEDCEGYNFEEVKLSDISVSESTFELQKKYYGKNILLLLNK